MLPSRATPIVAPTWRQAMIRPEPVPARSGADRATGRHGRRSAKPSPAPETTNQKTAQPVPLGDGGGSAEEEAPRHEPQSRWRRRRLAASRESEPGGSLWPDRAPCRRVARGCTDDEAADGGAGGGCPLPKGSWFVTAWKYWGIANISPNMANVTMVASTVPQVNRAERNRSRSTRRHPVAPGDTTLPDDKGEESRGTNHEACLGPHAGPALLRPLGSPRR